MDLCLPFPPLKLHIQTQAWVVATVILKMYLRLASCCSGTCFLTSILKIQHSEGICLRSLAVIS